MRKEEVEFDLDASPPRHPPAFPKGHTDSVDDERCMVKGSVWYESSIFFCEFFGCLALAALESCVAASQKARLVRYYGSELLEPYFVILPNQTPSHLLRCKPYSCN